MNLFTAPVYALFSVDFYRLLLRTGTVVKAIRYMLYLAAISTLFFFYTFTAQIEPAIQNFVTWTSSQMPELRLTQTGLETDVPTPYAMIHPELGAVAMIDTRAESLPPEGMQDVYVYVTRTKIYFQQSPGGQVSEYDVMRNVAENQRRGITGPVTIEPEIFEQIYTRIKPMVTGLFIFVFFGVFFLWKLLVGLFYSWIGLLLNLGRNPQLTFGQVYTLTLFAMTAGIVFQWLEAVLPFVANIPLAGLIGIGLTLGYLTIAVRKTQTPETGS